MISNAFILKVHPETLTLPALVPSCCDHPDVLHLPLVYLPLFTCAFKPLVQYLSVALRFGEVLVIFVRFLIVSWFKPVSYPPQV